jgi:hypothetical protein
MDKSKLKKLIIESYKNIIKKDSCNCGCHSCENVGNTGVILNENLNAKLIISENLQYHIQNKLPLTENTFRYGSKSFLDLWAEARYLYSRDAIYVNEDDKLILEETDLGNYGILENGERVPLDLPMENEEWPQEIPSLYGDIIFKLVKVVSDRAKYDLIDAETGKTWEIGGRIYKNPSQLYDDAENTIKPQGGRQSTYLGEDKKENKPIGKPMRDSSGGKAYKVYVRDPKTKKIKTVRFGSGGLKAKINNPEARRAFAKRHDCANKKDRTKPSYWSCRLPSYAKLLGLKGSFSGFW